jgi:hypothetical protein
MRIYLPLWLRTWGKSAEYGARSYVAACLTERDDYVSTALHLRLSTFAVAFSCVECCPTELS